MTLLNRLLSVSALVLSLTSVTTVAAPADDNAKIKARLAKIGLQANSIEDSAIPSIKQVMTSRGLFYISADGKYFLAGRIFDLENGMANLTEQALAGVRVEGMEKFEDSMIVFPAKNEKHQITVFTDTTCGYCRKLHSQIQDYNELGITVRYLAFPRGGLGSQSFNELSGVWCSNDQQKAMTSAKAGERQPDRKCSAPIAGHYNLGQATGVTGTPAIIFEDGSMIPGYKPPTELSLLLNQ